MNREQIEALIRDLEGCAVLAMPRSISGLRYECVRFDFTLEQRDALVALLRGLEAGEPVARVITGEDEKFWAGDRRAEQKRMQAQFNAHFQTYASAPPGMVPDPVWEALQRMIENGLQGDGATREDAELVAKWRSRSMVPPSDRVAEDYKALYHDLLMSVGNKHPGETRHETAKRYILNAERWSDTAGQAAPVMKP